MFCCTTRRKPSRDPESAPLLSDTDHSSPFPAPPHPPRLTPLQHAAHGPLHTLLVLRALRRGYLPSTAQLCAALSRVEGWIGELILSLEKDDEDREDGGDDDGDGEETGTGEERRVLSAIKTWVGDFRRLAGGKAAGDEFQRGVWGLRNAAATGAGGIWVAGETAGVGVGGGIGQPGMGWAAVKAVVGMVLGEEEVRGLLGDLAGVVRRAVGEGAVRGGEVAGVVGGEMVRDGGEGDGSVEGQGTPGELGSAVGDAARVVAASVIAGGEAAVEEVREGVLGEESVQGRRIRGRLGRILREAVVSVEEPGKRGGVVRGFVREWLRVWLGGYLGVRGVGVASVPGYISGLGAVVGRCGEREEWEELGRRWRAVVGKVVEGSQGGVVLNGNGVGNGKKGGATTTVAVDGEVLVERVVQRVVDGVAEWLEKPAVWEHMDEQTKDEKDAGADDGTNTPLFQLRQILRDAILLPVHMDGTQPPTTNNNNNNDTTIDPRRISLSKALDDLLSQAQTVYLSVTTDPVLTAFLSSTSTLLTILLSPSPPTPSATSTTQTILIKTLLHTLLPRLLSRIPCLPIPRVEILSPTADILLENLIITPIPRGGSPTSTSLLPSTITIKTNTNLNLTLPSSRAKDTGTTTTIHINNLTPLTAQKVGYILRLHPTRFLPTITSTGLISLSLPRGVSFAITHYPHARHRGVKVRVHIPELAYTIVDSTGCGGVMTLLRPFLSPLIRRLAEANIEQTLTQLFGDLDTEVALARQRVRGAKAAGHEGLVDVARAVWVGLGETVLGGEAGGGDSDGNAEEEEEEFGFSVGVKAGGAKAGKGRKGWEGVYAPGSVLGMWAAEEERERVRGEEAVRGRSRRGRRVEGWRSGVFDW